uniref:Ras-GEF domain-containing protein n=1 Tax=Macrostomum lignano TaxID=282301 RepID=A0A1I8IDG8_9PLAT
KYSDYDNRLGFEQFSQAVGHCLATCEPYATASGSAQQLAEPAVASESGYRTFDSSRPSPLRTAARRSASTATVACWTKEFDGRPRPLRPPDYDTYMNNSLDCGIGGVGVGAMDGVGVRRAARSKPPVPHGRPPLPPPLPPSTDGDAVGRDGPDADEYETLISQPAARGPPPPPPPPPRPSSLLPAKPQQPPPPPASAQERHRQRARSPMKRLVQAFTRPLSRSQSFRISRPSVATEPVSSAQPQPPTAASSSAALPAKQQQQQQSKPHQSLAKFASFVENPDRFSGSYHARGALLRERLRCVRQAYECVEACRQSLVAQIADLQSQLAGCPGSFDDANGSGGPASVAASSSSLPSTAMLRAVLPCIGDANGAT